ncbi:hypothetical protein GUITHDRAFT_131599 [Guillardia theta CCMP2712]|uniref:TFIIS central domain-containing protein n=2 Tax=Guillardia theta TaxID=55529 RepID=L1K465_GUITC|nr:hypothetical protein GUITHDRAFT_131599 [Guillardia theta CCMP2712]EKX55384.1 hypothetical protein GUITHDRAFT_131599 [Guillardia theta CCMP2712]|eukprot:XP_005842364.1 hypothetical protein GUITHDRAFT_131599 [Guillardia theta CCMP2712]
MDSDDASLATPTLKRKRSDDIEAPKQDQNRRKKSRETLAKAFSLSDSGQAQQFSTTLENSVYEFCKSKYGDGSFDKIKAHYIERIKTLKFNLERNTELRENVLSGQIPLDDLASMNSADLASTDVKQKRVTAAEESLKDRVNNEEVQRLKNSAEGQTMRKTDQGLVTVSHEAEAEQAKKEQEEYERKRLEEEKKKEEERNKAASIVAAGLNMAEEDQKSYLNSEWKPTLSNIEDDEDKIKHSVELSPMLEAHVAEPVTPDFDVHASDPHRELEIFDFEKVPLRRVWSGTIRDTNLHLNIDISHYGGVEVHDLFPKELIVRGHLDPIEAEKYVQDKLHDKSKSVGFYKILIGPDHAGKESVLEKKSSLDRQTKAHVLCEIKDKIIIYGFSQANHLFDAMNSDGDESILMFAVAIATRRKNHSKKVEPIPRPPPSLDRKLTSPRRGNVFQLSSTTFGKIQTSSCSMRLNHVTGEKSVEVIPKELVVLEKAELDSVIEYLLQNTVTVVEFEPEGEADTEAYLDFCKVLQEKGRAAVVLDTPSVLMYLIPPVSDAGKLLDPPSRKCEFMLGVLLFSPDSVEHVNEDAGLPSSEHAGGQSEGSAMDVSIKNEGAAVATMQGVNAPQVALGSRSGDMYNMGYVEDEGARRRLPQGSDFEPAAYPPPMPHRPPQHSEPFSESRWDGMGRSEWGPAGAAPPLYGQELEPREPFRAPRMMEDPLPSYEEHVRIRPSSDPPAPYYREGAWGASQPPYDQRELANPGRYPGFQPPPVMPHAAVPRWNSMPGQPSWDQYGGRGRGYRGPMRPYPPQ